MPTCLPDEFFCDGHIDCPDFSDENQCSCSDPQTLRCPTTGVCVNPEVSVCDGVNDCGDWSDEVDCECVGESFECANSASSSVKCINVALVCDGEPQCTDNSDETMCEMDCLSSQFRYLHRICIVHAEFRMLYKLGFTCTSKYITYS